MRFLVLTLVSVSLGVVPVQLHSPAAAYGGATCAGLPVTIDLNDPDHPRVHRPRSDVVLGTPEGEWIGAGRGDDVVCAGGGNDFLIGSRGDDVLRGGPGTDGVSYRQSVRPVRVDLAVTRPQRTGVGVDTLVGVEEVSGSRTQPNDIRGNAERNRITGGDAADVLVGRGEDDYVSDWEQADAGNDDDDDLLRGGDGDDYLYAGGGDDLMYGGAGSDLLIADFGIDVLYGGSGVDILEAWGRATDSEPDRIDGGAEPDFLAAASGPQLYDGGPGSDIIDFAGFGFAGATIDLAVDGPQDTNVAGIDEFVSVEGVYGSSGPDTILGDDGPNFLSGEGGADEIDGRGGTDQCEVEPTDSVAGCEEFL
ncbi:calcium-binding protein [Nocardioides antri]|uniref:Calcium-binding protein n=1 Tax=Nocardioides antri TaxID=2607659 RepID=A0A5B1LYW8_9ACTN|nr:hypothetical protein [Nocardioides antri]KAA1425853.1 hypothetical protein F0U47_16015 [Nocardioides antri]